MVLFGQKWLHSGKSGFIREMVVFGESSFLRAKVV